MTNKIYKIIIAGGGTGGHIFPAIAIANALKKMDASINILFVGANGKMEMEKVPKAGYAIKGIDIAGLNRSSVLKNISLPFKLIKSFWQVRNIFKSFMPDAVIGVGGYSSFPVLRFAQQKGIPTFIHESNSYAGKSNMMLGKHATKIFVAWDTMDKFFNTKKIKITGNPVRESIAKNTVDRKTAIEYFGLDVNKQTILSIGGSLGAKSINEAIAEHIDLFGENNLQLIWQAGSQHANYAAALAKDKNNIVAKGFIDNMEYAYAAADIVVSRAGAIAVAELCVMKKPTVFIPYPYAAEHHQTANAKHLADKNAAIMIKDADAKIQLVSTLITLCNNKDKQNELIENISALAIINADKVIAKEVMDAIRS